MNSVTLFLKNLFPSCARIHVKQIELEIANEVVIDERARKSNAADLYSVGPSQNDCEHDPITLEPLEPQNTFVFYTPDGHSIKYDTGTIANYFLRTGNFVDPVSRIIWGEDDIYRLEQALVSAKIYMNPNILTGMKTKLINTVAESESKYYILSLESCLGEMVSDLLTLVEGRVTPYSKVDLVLGLIFSQFEGNSKVILFLVHKKNITILNLYSDV